MPCMEKYVHIDLCFKIRIVDTQQIALVNNFMHTYVQYKNINKIFQMFAFL